MCAEAKVVRESEKTDTFDRCLDHCTETLGGPPACEYFAFTEDGTCEISATCLGHEDPLTNLAVRDAASGASGPGIMQVFCSLEDSAGMSCDSESLAQLPTAPHLTSCFDSCADLDDCNFFTFHPTTDLAGRGLCELFSSCLSYAESDASALVYIMDAAGMGVDVDAKVAVEAQQQLSNRVRSISSSSRAEGAAASGESGGLGAWGVGEGGAAAFIGLAVFAVVIVAAMLVLALVRSRRRAGAFSSSGGGGGGSTMGGIRRLRSTQAEQEMPEMALTPWRGIQQAQQAQGRSAGAAFDAAAAEQLI